MGTINIKPEIQKVKIKGRIRDIDVYSKAELKKFSPAVLGLGDIGAKSSRIEVVAVVFDLAGFTNFCSQVDPHLSMPRFLKEFLNWLFESIAAECENTKIKLEQGITLYSDLPFFAKFMGDGVLFLWNAENMGMVEVCNILITVRIISNQYSSVFVPKIEKHLSYVPKSLRCGVARGQVCSVGNGEDYVGPCINMASRLQKLSNIGFCCSNRGIDLEEGMPGATAERYVVKSVSIRGIGRDELVIIRKAEFEKLSKKDKAVFRDV
jgi:class 3 adenylate cyclase